MIIHTYTVRFVRSLPVSVSVPVPGLMEYKEEQERMFFFILVFKTTTISAAALLLRVPQLLYTKYTKGCVIILGIALLFDDEHATVVVVPFVDR